MYAARCQSGTCTVILYEYQLCVRATVEELRGVADQLGIWKYLAAVLQQHQYLPTPRLGLIKRTYEYVTRGS
eukprot:scaffold25185_cov32-Prasinocladus_malaysianus.AAC.1